jgi:hypothetical protein
MPKGAALPLAFGALGVGYFVATQLRKPTIDDMHSLAQWQRHARDAKVALVAGLGAAAMLWLLRPTKTEHAVHSTQ